MKIKDTPKIIEEITRQCAICGKDILVHLFPKGKYKGGNYFCKIPICSKFEINKTRKAGFTKKQIAQTTLNVFKKDPKPYKYVEYWECDKCYNNQEY